MDGNQSGIDNAHMVTNHHAIRSRDNIYEYRDSPSSKTLASKAMTETTSLRSPSSLAMTQKSGSQSSLKSGISMKESNGGTIVNYTPNLKPSRVEAAAKAVSNGNAKSLEEKRLLQRDPIVISSTPVSAATNNAEPTYKARSVAGSMGSRSTTPIPTARTTTTTATLSSAPSVQVKNPSTAAVQTQVIEGIPQTSV